MCKLTFIDTQIVSILKHAEAGVPVKDLCQDAHRRGGFFSRKIYGVDPRD